MKKKPIELSCDKCGKDARGNEYFFRVCSCCVDDVREFMKGKYHCGHGLSISINANQFDDIDSQTHGKVKG